MLPGASGGAAGASRERRGTGGSSSPCSGTRRLPAEVFGFRHSLAGGFAAGSPACDPNSCAQGDVERQENLQADALTRTAL